MPPRRPSLFGLTAPHGARALSDRGARFRLVDLVQGRSLDVDPRELRGRRVLIATDRQLPAALAMIQLDGIAARMVLCPPDVSREHCLEAIADAEVDTVVSDASGPDLCQAAGRVRCFDRIVGPHGIAASPGDVDTEWVLFTSGTSGRPKLVAHTLTSLVGPLVDGVGTETKTTWTTFYDIRRYGGLTILMRALAGGGSMVVSDPDETPAEFMARAGAEAVTHISGTPSHWRRALMSAATDRMSPGYVRLSGEACDQSILNALRQAFPAAGIAHAFASTEAGFAFDVRDGRAGFPESLIGQDGAVKLRVNNGSLHIRSPRTASRYLGVGVASLLDQSGYVDTGDLVELRGDRYYFHGRRDGVINVGGLKVHPEMVEAVINRHPSVRMSRVSPRANPITGSIVVAEIVTNLQLDAGSTAFDAVKSEILGLCRDTLAAHQMPAILRLVPSLEVAASGKMVRRRA
ncbi:ANL family adenylate-forming protein [Rhodopila sp.]|uniref:ANL family adenylate-forming protein n=1 Tax=Rhodopila sp. TaxID=2480087 RepID=UPI003D0A4645